jgi:hypothetical protein
MTRVRLTGRTAPTGMTTGCGRGRSGVRVPSAQTRKRSRLAAMLQLSEGAREITGKRIRRAAERGWKVPDAIRTDALCRIAELLKSPGLTPRDLASILRTLVAFDRTDMLDEKLTLDRAKWAAGQPKETVETAADLARQLLDAARGHEESGP